MADMYYGIYFIDIGSDTLLEYVADNKKYRYAGIRVKDMIKILSLMDIWKGALNLPI